MSDAEKSRVSRAWRVLALTSSSTFLVSLDTSIVVVARKAMIDDLGHPTLMTWVFSAYSIAYAAGLLTAGRFADVFGRKASFLRGLTLFSIGSLLCGIAPSAIVLVIARVIQALGGAMLTPASLALVLPEFPVEKRTQAIGVWGATGGLAAALGPSIGGLLVDSFGWRSLFFVNVPLTVVTVFIGRRVLHESRDENATRKVDYPSVFFGFIGVALVVLGISQSEEWGWLDARNLASIAAGLLLVAMFAVRCTRIESPLLDLKLFKLPFVVAANISGVFFSIGFIGMWLLNTTWLQAVWGYGVAQSGLATMPGPAMAAFIAPFAGRFATKYGHARVLFVGAVLLSLGTLGLTNFVPVEPAYWSHYFGWMIMTGTGVGLSISTLSSSATAFLKPTQFAMGSALNSTFRQVGTALGAPLSLTIAAPAISQIFAAQASGKGFDGVDFSTIHHAWNMNAGIYFTAGVVMLVIFRKPTDDQMRDAGKVSFVD